jgi:hypothetical protein
VIERRDGPRLAFKAVGELLRGKLDRDFASEARIAGAPYLSMPPLPSRETIS